MYSWLSAYFSICAYILDCMQNLRRALLLKPTIYLNHYYQAGTVTTNGSCFLLLKIVGKSPAISGSSSRGWPYVAPECLAHYTDMLFNPLFANFDFLYGLREVRSLDIYIYFFFQPRTHSHLKHYPLRTLVSSQQKLSLLSLMGLR